MLGNIVENFPRMFARELGNFRLAQSDFPLETIGYLWHGRD